MQHCPKHLKHTMPSDILIHILTKIKMVFYNIGTFDQCKLIRVGTHNLNKG